MAKTKINPLWIIGGILLVILIFNSNQVQETQSIIKIGVHDDREFDDDERVISIITTQSQLIQSSVKDHSSREACESSRLAAIADGSQCVGDCIFIDNGIFDCLDGYIDNDDKDRWGFFEAPFDRSCSTSDSKTTSHNGQSYSYSTIRECMEGGDNQDECNDRGFAECIDDDTLRECNVGSSGFLEWLSENCGSTEECRSFDDDAWCQEVAACENQDHRECFNNDVYWFDCNDDRTDLYRECNSCVEASPLECHVECETNSDCSSGKECDTSRDGGTCVTSGTTGGGDTGDGDDNGNGGTGETCENFWENPDTGCTTFNFILWAGVGIIALIVLQVLFKKK